MAYEEQLHVSRQYWDNLAPSFDDEPDHGLRNPIILETWTKLLKEHIPFANGTILDIGCGTGSISVVLAGLGHKVIGIDLSPEMTSLAQAKAEAHGYPIKFHVMDAAFPLFSQQQFDLILCRHLLWALPEPEQVLQRWIKFLRPSGRLFMVEGYWGTGAGLHAKDLTAILPPAFTKISIQNLSDNPNYWGRNITDERYAIIADL